MDRITQLRQVSERWPSPVAQTGPCGQVASDRSVTVADTPDGASLFWCSEAKQHNVQRVMSGYLNFVRLLDHVIVGKSPRSISDDMFVRSMQCL